MLKVNTGKNSQTTFQKREGILSVLKPRKGGSRWSIFSQWQQEACAE